MEKGHRIGNGVPQKTEHPLIHGQHCQAGARWLAAVVSGPEVQRDPLARLGRAGTGFDGDSETLGQAADFELNSGFLKGGLARVGMVVNGALGLALIAMFVFFLWGRSP